MISYRSIAKTLFLSAVLLLCSTFFAMNLSAQDGKTLFNTNCAACHAVNKRSTGPALAGVEDRWPDKTKLHAWVKNSAAFLKTGDVYANNLYNEYNKTAMNQFPGLSDKDIDAILAYIKSVPAPGADKPAGSAVPVPEGDNSLLFGVLTLVLAIVALILLRVNGNLRKLSIERSGEATEAEIPFWKHKSYIALMAVVLFIVGGYLTTKGAMGLGRSQNYQPVQPIYYSHKVHAGTNQINCLYCHGGAQEGKHSNIPSVNICMNCHMSINEYKGEKIYTEEGVEVDGTKEIEKLYKFAGFTFGKPFDASAAKPIEWTRIHNLPDHVYFNHSQHVKAGKVQCQTCHGDITKMDEVKQFADLSMGWCINCHRETKVQFKDNGFYSIYEKFHQDLKSGKIDSTKGITVEKIGGTECQKCHY
ncbi:MAG: c-type cytochrome [Bacteroidota bacterium]